MIKNLWIMCGIPGSGKSTWLANNILRFTNSIIISRDKIRFSMLGNEDDYFSKERKVFNTFINEIQTAINDGVWDIFVDATHINENSRKKLLRNLQLEDYAVNVIVINKSLETCCEQNAKRSGLQCVPKEAIERMYKDFQHPSKDSYKYNLIIDIY